MSRKLSEKDAAAEEVRFQLQSFFAASLKSRSVLRDRELCDHGADNTQAVRERRGAATTRLVRFGEVQCYVRDLQCCPSSELCAVLE